MQSTSFNEAITPAKPSSALNVFTILSIVGSSLSLLSSIAGYFTADMNYERNKEVFQSGKMDEMPSILKGMIDLDMLQKLAENKLPILLIGLLCSLLCLLGAIQMRKLKMQGYFLWMAGEILAPVAMVILVGTSVYSGFKILSLIFPLAFIIIYTVYKKELK